MKNWLLSLALFMSLSSNGQERLSQFNNGKQSAYEQGFEWNDNKYIISFLVSGEVSIYQFKGPDDLRTIFEQLIPSAYNLAFTTRFYENWVIFQSSTKQYTYDLERRQLYQYDLPVGPFDNGVESMLHAADYCILRFEDQNNDLNYYYILDYDRGIEKFPPAYGTPVCRNGHEFVCHSFDYANGTTTSKFNVIDIKTGDQKLMVKDLPNQPTVNYYDQHYWFVVQNVPCSFDPVTTVLKKYEAIKLSYYGSTSVHKKGDVLIVMGGVPSNFQIVCYDTKSSKILSNSQGVAGGGNFMTEKVRLYGQYLLCFDAGNRMYQFDYQKGFVRKYKVSYIPYPLSNIIPNVRENEDYLYNGKGFTKIRFQQADTMFIPIDTGTLIPAIQNFTTFQWDDGRVLALQLVNLERTTNHYWIDLKNSIATAANPTKSPRGMDESSRFFQCGSRLYLWSNGLYYLTENGMEKLPSQSSGWGQNFNFGQGRNVYCMPRDTIMESYTLENDQLVVWHHTGGKAVRFGQIPHHAKIYEVMGLGERIYVYEYKSKYNLSIYKTDGQKIFSEESSSNTRLLQGSPSDYSFYTFLGQVGRKALYIRDTLLLSMDENGIIKTVHKSKEFKALTYIFTNRGRNYLYTNSESFNLYEITGDKLIKLYQSDENLNAVYSSEEHGKTFIYLNDQQSSLLVWDGTNIIKVGTPPGMRQVAIEKDYILGRVYQNRTAYLIDMRDLRLRKIEPGPEREHFTNIAITPNDTILYSYAEEGVNMQIKTYRFHSQFTQVSPLENFPNSWFLSKLNVEGSGNTRLVYSQHLSGTLVQGGLLSLTSDVKARKTLYDATPIYKNDHLVQASYLYFMGQEKVNGLQLYRIPIDNTGTMVTDVNSDDLLIYPNPTSGQLTWETSAFNNSQVQYCIKDIKGGLVRRGAASSSLDITDLGAGSYIFELTIGQRTFKKLIVKI